MKLDVLIVGAGFSGAVVAETFGAVKAWTAFAIASNEIASRHRLGFDETVKALFQPDRQRHERQVQGNKRSWPRPICSALLSEWGSSPDPALGIDPRGASFAYPQSLTTFRGCRVSQSQTAITPGWLRDGDPACRYPAHTSRPPSHWR